MKHEMISLSYSLDSLAPFIGKETMEYHYSKHYKSYVDTTNLLIEGTDFISMNLVEIIKNAPIGPLYNNAAQAWNHSLFFSLLTQSSTKKPIGKIEEYLNRDFSSFEKFKEDFTISATSNFGSGWTWLFLNGDGKLEIKNTQNAINLLKEENTTTVLGLDVWEHAYYLDTRNNRKQYVDNFWNVVDWEKVNNLLTKKI